VGSNSNLCTDSRVCKIILHRFDPLCISHHAINSWEYVSSNKARQTPYCVIWHPFFLFLNEALGTHPKLMPLTFLLAICRPQYFQLLPFVSRWQFFYMGTLWSWSSSRSIQKTMRIYLSTVFSVHREVTEICSPCHCKFLWSPFNAATQALLHYFLLPQM